ncbi:hypothetical protein [Thermococcus thioreducens]|uniref:DUF1450 domain-containing protein n=1 Tax=Thermococcus thioreducens TaxID=277988 RepID=A0A0Q2MQQ7_9EURY|nr:hypothetical protein [Thermococcus thioreducens]ASJ12691.1 hypothetical protein A3L14_07240 [Thermococcus thioreducens]KQH82023.1 hypothetical protein AMR53_08015 [Thermococcus thioreducens]SEV86656.1 hypothetical protein SAMN05216170_0501 [Thermococcus thioreducens]
MGKNGCNVFPTAKVCKFCAGERLDDVVSILKRKGYEVSVEGCLGLCAKYDCGNINVIAGKVEISVRNMEELETAVGGGV